MSRTSKAWEALQNGLRQTVETVTRNARVEIVSGGIDEIDPPEEIDEYAETAKNTAIVRANMRKFVNDVWQPGYRVEGPDETVQYFEGEQEDIDAPAPSETPENGFLSQCFVIGGERHQDFYTGGKEATRQKWVRGTTLVEYLKADKTDPESEITGFYFIRPETVYPQVQNNTNILLPPNPEDLPDDIGEDDYTETRRGEVAAYIQFDDESILGIRRDGYDGQEIPLSQNDVLKQSLEADIGGDIGTAEGVFGTSIIEPVADDISEYKQIKRDRAEAISRKAYGVWTAQFTPEVLDLGDGGIEIIEWDDDSIGDTEAELNAMGPGDVLSSDASIDLERHDGDVPELEPTLSHYIDDIQSALPVPGVLATDFDADINRDVTGDKKDDYQQTVSEERQYQEKSWTQALRTVAERLGLPTEGLELKIQPEKSDNPVKSLESEEIDRMNSYVNTLSVAAGPQAGPTALVSSEELLDVLDFPVRDADPEDVVEEMSTEETEAAWQDIMGVESLQTRYEEGDIVATPDGDGVVSGVWEASWEDDGETIEASEDSPAYTVALVDGGFGHFKASDLSETDLETDVEEPISDLEALIDVQTATGNYEALDWTNPPSWRESETPARVIALKAWADMNGQFDCGGACCMGDLKDAELCASLKDYVLGTEQWRGWGPD